MTVMVFKAPGATKLHEVMVDWKVVDESEVDTEVAAGWHVTPLEAHAVFEAHQAEEAAARDAADLAKLQSAPPTRDELEAKARELGLKFDGRTGDAKLLKMIEAALAPA